MILFQCRTRLCLWCKWEWVCDSSIKNSFNAARGFVCGASIIGPIKHSSNEVSMPHAALFVVQVFIDSTFHYYWTFQCRTRLCLWCKTSSYEVVYWKYKVSMPHAALFVVQDQFTSDNSLELSVSMPHAALFVVQGWIEVFCIIFKHVSMPHAALFVVQDRDEYLRRKQNEVSMPHAALFVVQGASLKASAIGLSCFNAARGFVCGARPRLPSIVVNPPRFNAARGFVCGAR